MIYSYYQTSIISLKINIIVLTELLAATEYDNLQIVQTIIDPGANLTNKNTKK